MHSIYPVALPRVSCYHDFMDEKKRYITVTEFSDLVHVSKPTLYKLLRASKIPALKLGDTYRVTMPDAIDNARIK